MSDEQQAPERIWTRPSRNGTVWSINKLHHNDVEYIRADLSPVAKAPEAENLPMPMTEETVAWAEEAQSIADVLRELSDKFNGIDNGRCTVCRVGHRLWIVPGKKKGPCDYEACLSHRIEPILERYEPPSPETLERIRKNCERAISKL